MCSQLELHGYGLELPPARWCGICFSEGVPKVIYRADHARRGFIAAMLEPVNKRPLPKFGVRQTLLILALAFGLVALGRLLLAN